MCDYSRDEGQINTINSLMWVSWVAARRVWAKVMKRSFSCHLLEFQDYGQRIVALYSLSWNSVCFWLSLLAEFENWWLTTGLWPTDMLCLPVTIFSNISDQKPLGNMHLTVYQVGQLPTSTYPLNNPWLHTFTFSSLSLRVFNLSRLVSKLIATCIVPCKGLQIRVPGNFSRVTLTPSLMSPSTSFRSWA